ncbi:MAG: pectate lyase [Ignavibacteriae bacterium]|nr:pectate lyase [Ignavibacteriota bacterium]
MNFKITIFNLLSILFLFYFQLSYAQLDTNRFHDSAHHWYDINDDEKIIEPLLDKPKYNSSEFVKIADNILLFQKSNGGWAKNYDMQAILNSDQKSKIISEKNKLNTTFDNGATHSQLSYLAEVYTITKDEKYINSFLKGLDFVLTAQYNNGGFPQFFPDTSGYRKYITFNDGAMLGVMKLLFNITNQDSNYLFIPNEYFEKVNSAFENGVQCILNCQITENNLQTVWCQQHDNKNLKPQNARTFEPAAICNMESAEIVLFLMKIKNPNEKIKTAIMNAVSWFEKSAINGIRVETFKSTNAEFIYHKTEFDRKIVEDKNAPRIWTRFYDLKTHQPIFCRRDGKIVQSLEEVERERRTGYAWYTYEPEEVLQLYQNWMKKNYE